MKEPEDHFEIEQDPTLIGNKLEVWIEKHFPKLTEWSHNNDCGCIWRRDRMNDIHQWFRDKFAH